jgi:probable addiction module antidote protein
MNKPWSFCSWVAKKEISNAMSPKRTTTRRISERASDEEIMKNKHKPYGSYEQDLSKRLKDPRYAADYLNAVLQDPEAELSTFLLAVADVARAHGMKEVAHKAALHRVGLHKMLRKKGNPEFRSITKILKAVNLGFTVQPTPFAAAA